MKGNKKYTVWEERKKVFVYRWLDYIHRNSLRMDPKFLEIIRSYSKVIGYNVTIQKSIGFLYIDNEQLEFEIKNTTSLILAPKKYLSIFLTKYVQDLDEENYKILIQEIKEDLSKWRESSCAWTERPITVKMLAIPDSSTDLVQSESKHQ